MALNVPLDHGLAARRRLAGGASQVGGPGGRPPRLAGGFASLQHVDEDCVELVNLAAYLILVAGVEHPLRRLRHSDAGGAPAGEVEQVGDDDRVVACAGLVGEAAVRRAARVPEDDGVASQPGGQDVGLSLGDLVILGPQVLIAAEELHDGRVESQPVGGTGVVEVAGSDDSS